MKHVFSLGVISALASCNSIVRICKKPLIAAVFTAFATLPVKAAIVDFSFTGEIYAVNTSDVFLSNLFPIGTSGSAHVVLDYDAEPSSATILSFSAMLGFSNYAMADGANHEVHITNEEPHFLALYDRVLFNTYDVIGPSFFGYSATSMHMVLEDYLNNPFDNDQPSPSELTAISNAETQYLTIFFANSLGENAGGVVLRPTDRMIVKVINEVAAPATFVIMLCGLLGIGEMSRRKTAALHAQGKLRQNIDH